MATMRPGRVEELGNKAGEDREEDVYRWLQQNLPDHAIVLHEPAVFDARRRQRRPDFLIFWEQTDCVAIEVKNWRMENIVDGDGLQVTLRTASNQTKKVTHPMQQAKDMAYAVMQHFERDQRHNPDFVAADGKHAGKLTFCVTPVVVMLGASEADREALCNRLGGLHPDHIITEEALRDAQSLRDRLCHLAFPVPLLGERRVLQAAADILFPPSKTMAQIEEENLIKAEDMVPTITDSPRPEPLPEPEADTARYNRLRGELAAVTREAAELIASESGGGNLQVQELNGIIDALDQDAFKVGVFGVTAAGKSTFINAILQERLLTSGLGETSKTITWLHPATEANPHDTCVIHLKTAETLNSELAGYLADTLLIDAADCESTDKPAFDIREALVRDKLKALVSGEISNHRESERAAAGFIKALLGGWDEFSGQLGSTIRGTFEALNELAHTEHKAVFVLRRDLYMDNPMLGEGFMFVDAPGVGSSLNRHTDLAIQCARQVDAALMLTKVDYQFMPPDREFVRKALDIKRHQRHHNLFFILNQIGRINPLEYRKTPAQFDECVAEQCDRLRERLASEEIKDVDIYPVDSLCALYAQRAANNLLDDTERDAYDTAAMTDKKADLPDPQKNLVASRFPAMLEDLRHKLTRIKYGSFLGIKRDKLQNAVETFSTLIEENIAGLGKDISRIEEELKEHQKNSHYVKVRLENYLPVFERDVSKIFNHLEDERDEEGNVIRKGELTELIETWAERAAKKYKKFYLTKERYLDDVRSDLQEITIRDLQTLRDKYEKSYRGIRDRVLEHDLRNQVENYANMREWQFRMRQIELTEQEGIQGIEKLDVSFFSKAWVWIWNWSQEERAKKLAESFAEAFTETLTEPFKKDVTGWIEEDRQHVQEQIIAIFDQINDEIKARIEQQLEEHKAKTGERAARHRQLLRYRKEVDKLLEKLHELDDQVRAATPANP